LKKLYITIIKILKIKMSFPKVPIYTTGAPGVPSREYMSRENTFYSAYTGSTLPSHPTFATKTDDSSNKNSTYHGCIKVSGSKAKMCH
jgi:hypothetical protein